ncbi:MFS family transporter [Lichenifustis flavocetrariae]|uniref:Alpha-ketoglutarate permease n=1 Tax=Lichenifustis flavocetrariae TaxID=2949735 RepID=A0AA42CL69_9HYPH|nr:MFS family transporter [Lichenifustis flavocetrariae]MCW6510066.1 MFS family transporter [Lichenifustis flavocetrariae]
MRRPTELRGQESTEAWSSRRRVFAILGSSSGNLIEWYDFYAYAFTQLYFAAAFIPSGNATTRLLYTSGIFAVGFFMRPVGGWLFGIIADRAGRRASMMVSVLLMCGGSLAVAVLPTYAEIGLAAPILLLLARLIQGLSVGGEYGTSATYMSEVALAGRRGFLSSFQYVTLIGGQLLASLVILLLQQGLSDTALRGWGWRIPFVLGALGALVVFFLRRALPETSSQATRARREAGSLRELFRHHLRPFLVVLGYTAGGSLSFYVFTTYMQKYLVNSAHMSDRTANVVMTAVLFTYMCLQPLFGWLSDRIGRRSSMLAFGVLATLCTVPLMRAIGSVENPVAAYGLVTAALAIVSFYTSISGLVKAEMFPAEIRALGVGFSYAIANALFGGTAEYVALWFKDAGHESWFFWYVTLMCGVALLTILTQLPRRAAYLQGQSTE